MALGELGDNEYKVGKGCMFSGVKDGVCKSARRESTTKFRREGGIFLGFGDSEGINRRRVMVHHLLRKVVGCLHPRGHLQLLEDNLQIFGNLVQDFLVGGRESSIGGVEASVCTSVRSRKRMCVPEDV